MATWAKKPGQTAQQAQADANNSSVYRQSVGFATGQAQPQQSPYATSTQPQKNKAGDFAAYSPTFQFRGTDFMGNTFNNPQAMTSQQGAMVQAMNNQRANQIQSGNIGRLDPFAAYTQGQQMIQGGWQNPFAQQPMLPNLAAQAFPPQYQAPPEPPAAPRPSPGLMLSPDFPQGGRSWTPVPGYGFDRQGNQVPVGMGGIFSEPPPQRPARPERLRQNPAAQPFIPQTPQDSPEPPGPRRIAPDPILRLFQQARGIDPQAHFNRVWI